MDSVKFSQVHEDPDIELELVNKTADINKTILLIASGGETGFYLLNDTITQIEMVDFNESQIMLCKKKLECIKTDNYSELKTLGTIGIYEKMFASLSTTKIQNVFSNENLIKHFTSNAVKYSTKKTFYEHFAEVIEKLKLNYLPDNYWRNQLTCETSTINPVYWSNISNIKSNWTKLKFYCANLFDFISNTKLTYNLISLSNITDWMDIHEITKLVSLAHKVLKPNGYVLIRKLISDHDLSSIIASTGLYLQDENYQDKSLLYTQVLALRKLEQF